MKKKVIAVLVMAFVVMGIVACGSEKESGTGAQDEKRGSKEMIIKVEGKEYDLSGDFQSNVGQMVKDGYVVAGNGGMSKYSEEGKFAGKYNFQTDDVIFCQADEYSQFAPQIFTEAENGFCPIVRDYYIFGRKDSDVDYETAQGIKKSDSISKVKELENYILVSGRMRVNDETYAAFYMDGKIVDLSEYEDDYSTWYEDCNEIGMDEASKKILSNYNAYPSFSRLVDGNFLRQEIENVENSVMPCFKEEMLMLLASWDANKLMEKGEIDSYDIIFYEDMGEDSVWTYYYHFYYDAEWDRNKFVTK